MIKPFIPFITLSKEDWVQVTHHERFRKDESLRVRKVLSLGEQAAINAANPLLAMEHHLMCYGALQHKLLSQVEPTPQLTKLLAGIADLVEAHAQSLCK